MRRLSCLLALIATPAAAQVRAVADRTASASAARDGVDVFLLNEGTETVTQSPPAEVKVDAANLDALTLVPPAADPVTLAPGGFVKLRYRLADARVVEESVAAAGAASPVIAPEAVSRTSLGAASGFVDRIAPYEPIYGVFGLGDAGAKLQFSFVARPFGGTGLLSRFHAAYTQTMFWAIDRPSGPFRQTTYSPEAFVDLPLSDRATLAVGYRHDSNGRGFPGTIDVNRIYLRAARRFDLGDGWSAELVPQAWFYIDHRGARTLDEYWGYTSIKGAIGQEDGIKLSVTARGNPGTGKGGAELFASYPLAGIGRGLGIYVFGQGYTGYGEALDDYRIRDTHLRLGIAVTR